MHTKRIKRDIIRINNMILLDGKKLRDETAAELRDEIADFVAESGEGVEAVIPQSVPQLAILQIGDLAESSAYINQKKLFGEKIGAKVTHKTYPAKVSEEELVADIKKLNIDSKIHGIIVQLPIPASLDKQKILDAVAPQKDVDGLTATNIKRLWANDERVIMPATVRGVISLLEHYEIPIEGQKVTVIGRSMLVGKPLALALLNKNATVTLCHRKTKNLAEEARNADILVVAAGSKHLIGKNFVKKGQVVIDVGINFADSKVNAKITENKIAKNNLMGNLKPENEIPKQKMVGDVDFEAVKDIVSAISPVPGGVGPMTVASLFQNLVETWKTQEEI